LRLDDACLASKTILGLVIGFDELAVKHQGLDGRNNEAPLTPSAASLLD
jgi:hypothetical protein